MSSPTRSDVVTRVSPVSLARSARLIGPPRNSDCRTSDRLCRRVSSGKAFVVGRSVRRGGTRSTLMVC